MNLPIRRTFAPLAALLLFATLQAPDAHAQYYGRPPPRYYVARENPDANRVGLNLGLDLEGAADVTPPQGTAVDSGGGFKLRVGAEIRRPFLRIIPEGGFGYTHLFVSDIAGNNVGWNMERLFVGVRVGFGRLVVPVVYGHVGYGWRTTGGAPPGEGSSYLAANGLTADGGVGLDFHLIRRVGFGVHAEYVTVQADPGVPDWIAVGAHLDTVFK